MDGRLAHGDMENATENPSKAAEYLKELNNIIETQQELLEKQKGRIEELEHQVNELCEENACLKEQHQRHLATCRLQQLSSIKEHVMQEKVYRAAVIFLASCTDVNWLVKWQCCQIQMRFQQLAQQLCSKDLGSLS
ncbi:IQ motif and SEC7 domain-containing protein 1 isoform X1 [Tachysurus ichikawai]